MAKGLVSGKYQLTLPVAIRKALGVRPGDHVEYTVKGGRLEVRVLRPDMGQVLDAVLAEHDFSALRAETEGDAVRFVRENRGLDD